MNKYQDQIQALNEQLDGLMIGEVIKLEGIPNAVYHGCKGDSSSKLKDSCQSMMYYQKRYITGEIEGPTGAHFDVGNLAHAMILEPETVGRDFIKKPDIPQPTTPQREKYARWEKAGRPAEGDSKLIPSDICRERVELWRELEQKADHLRVVDDEHWKIAELMTKAVNENGAARALLTHKDRKSEVSYFTRHANTGRIIKCRTDIDVGSIIGDIKTISLRRKVDEKYLLNVLRSEITQRKYNLSAAMYLDITGASEFVWVFVNKEPNYHWVAVIRASDLTLEEGRRLYDTQIEDIQRCAEINHWPEPSSIQRIFNPLTEQFELPII